MLNLANRKEFLKQNIHLFLSPQYTPLPSWLGMSYKKQTKMAKLSSPDVLIDEKIEQVLRSIQIWKESKAIISIGELTFYLSLTSILHDGDESTEQQDSKKCR